MNELLEFAQLLYWFAVLTFAIGFFVGLSAAALRDWLSRD